MARRPGSIGRSAIGTARKAYKRPCQARQARQAKNRTRWRLDESHTGPTDYGTQNFRLGAPWPLNRNLQTACESAGRRANARSTQATPTIGNETTHVPCGARPQIAAQLDRYADTRCTETSSIAAYGMSWSAARSVALIALMSAVGLAIDGAIGTGTGGSVLLNSRDIRVGRHTTRLVACERSDDLRTLTGSSAA